MLRQAVLFLFTCWALLAQVERAAIVGNVTDKSGASMAGVDVVVTNEATNTKTLLVSDESGGYTAVNLIPGSYSITASHSGFRPVIFRTFVLQVGQTARLDISMEVGNVEQTVEVTGAIPLLQTENASVGQVIEQTAVNALPLNGRNFVQLAILAPGFRDSITRSRPPSTPANGRTNCGPAAPLFRPTARSASRTRCCSTASTTPR